ncbi:MAG: AmmeMemoRadiSam system protein B [Thermodesulfobacteriota bacterium]
MKRITSNELGFRSRIIPIVLAAFLVLAGPFAFEAQAQQEIKVRPAALAGTWYPGRADELTALVKRYLAEARPPRPTGRLIALAVPHAGLIYSGPTAAHAFALLAGQDFETVVLVGPSHQARFEGVALDLRDYETPLGRVQLDRDLAGSILAKGGPLVAESSRIHDREHCLEIELPFLQTVLGRAKIVPLLMGSQDLTTCRTLAKALANAARGRKVLLLASTDLSHFYKAETAQAMDHRLLERVKAFDTNGLHQELSAGHIEACGGGPLTAIMLAAAELGANKATVLKYSHSGEVSGDNSRVVGYMAAAFTADGPPRTSGSLDPGLASAEQKLLLSLARQSILAGLENKTFVPPEPLPAALKAPRGAFVTLKKRGELRGCIGRLESERPLAEVVTVMAQAAAFEDHRFPPLTKAELPDLRLEISVLTPFQPVKEVEEIQVGRHGLIVLRGPHSGLLLPQVPVEEGWDREQFLDFTCRKAGLPFKCWREAGTRLYSFSAQVFSEAEP